MPTLADILAAIDAIKRGLATNPLETAKDYGRGAVNSMADMGDMLMQANPNAPPGVSLGQMSRGLLGSTGTSVENTGGLLGIPGGGTTLSAMAKLGAIGKEALPLGGLLGQMVFHGTPHQVEKYSLDRIGTGEGAQAYGHGMYFADNPDVAKEYQPKGWKRSYTYQGRDGGDWQSQFENAQDYGRAQVWESIQLHVPKDRLLQSLADEGYAPDVIAYAKGLPKKLFAPPGGLLYKQDLPDAALPNLLQWDRPLSEQPASVQKIAIPAVQKSIAEGWTTLKDANKATGQDAMAALQMMADPTGANWAQSAPKVAETLRAAGIPGLSYLDQGSRAGGKGTMNHVIWDQDLLDKMIPTPVP